MPLFHYRALARSGEAVSGSLEALDPREAVALLQDRGLLPINAQPDQPAWWRRELRSNRGARIGRRDLALLTRELAALIGAGLTVDRTLHILSDMSTRPAIRTVLKDLLDRVRAGAALSDALAAHHAIFPAFYRNMVRAAEAGGFLATALLRLADVLERAQKLRDSVGSALLYPMVLLAMAGASIILIVTVVLPQFTPMFAEAGVELPLLLRVLLGIGWLTGTYPLLSAAGTAGLVAMTISIARSATVSRWAHRRILTLPVIGVTAIRLDVARISRSLSMLLESGIPLPEALTLSAGLPANRVIAASLGDAALRVREGASLASCLASGLFPQAMREMVQVGEETGKLPQMLAHCAELTEADFQRTLDRAMALLTPAMTLALGLLIAALIGSVVTVLMSVNDLAI
jgi:general secretion pathway protein F